MSALEQLTWSNFKATVLLPGEHRVHLIRKVPRVAIFGDGTSNRVGLWLELKTDGELPKELVGLSFMSTRKFVQDDRLTLEITTTAPALHRQFYHFASAVADRVLADPHCNPVEAATLEILCFGELLEEQAVLGIERQIGLLGELIFLDRLVVGLGPRALDAWLGPRGEPHDFRLATTEFEVKATTSTRRLHTIHGTEQLVASKGCTLCLVSVLLGPPGAGLGVSLASAVDSLAAKFSASPLRASEFKAALKTCGIRESEHNNYTRQFVMRRPIALVPINVEFPAITRLTVKEAFGARAARLDDLSYDINVEGLETEDGTDGFDILLPM